MFRVLGRCQGAGKPRSHSRRSLSTTKKRTPPPKPTTQTGQIRDPLVLTNAKTERAPEILLAPELIAGTTLNPSIQPQSPQRACRSNFAGGAQMPESTPPVRFLR